MKTIHLLISAIPLFIFACNTNISTGSTKILGGELIDVVVRGSGTSDSTFMTIFDEVGMLYTDGPYSFDVDKDGNIYVLDWLLQRVQKFDKGGRWTSTLKIPAVDDMEFRNIAVDNRGNMYLRDGDHIAKFSPEGEYLLQTEKTQKSSKGFDISVDRTGRIYNESFNKINIYDSELNLMKTIDEFPSTWRAEYRDMNVAQEEAGDDVYFRWHQYLLRTSLEEYTQSGRVDTVAVLPNELRLTDYMDKDYPTDENTERLIGIGFDKHNYFYFYKEAWYYGKDERQDICTRYSILRYHLGKEKLTKTGEGLVDLLKDKEECSRRALEYFWLYTKEFVVTGDGTIYWLHGTVDTVKVSKIIFDE